MKIYIGADHRGQELSFYLFNKLKGLGYDIEESKIEKSKEDDYPDFAFDVCKKVLENKNNLGILICGNGIGVSIAANKVKGIRCGRVVSNSDAFSCRNHNGCNVIALGVTPYDEAMDYILTFLHTDYPSEERHLRRVNKIIQYEDNHEL